jgi:hypothetical protein
MERRAAEKGIVTRILRNWDDWSSIVAFRMQIIPDSPAKRTLRLPALALIRLTLSSVTIRDRDDRCHHLISPARSCWQPGSRRPEHGHHDVGSAEGALPASLPAGRPRWTGVLRGSSYAKSHAKDPIFATSIARTAWRRLHIRRDQILPVRPPSHHAEKSSRRRP